MTTQTKKKRNPQLLDENKRPPKVAAVWPRLNEPDTKFDAKGLYSMKWKLPVNSPTAQKLMQDIDRLTEETLQEAIANAKNGKEAKAIRENTKNKPYEILEDDDGITTGEVQFTAKMRASYSKIDKASGREVEVKQRPAIMSVKGVAYKDDEIPQIGNGTVGRVVVEMAPYCTQQAGAGVSLRLVGFQILELVEFGSRTAAGMGLMDESGEYPEDEPSGSTAGSQQNTSGSSFDDDIPF